MRGRVARKQYLAEHPEARYSEYRNWLRAGVRLFDTNPSVLSPGDRVSYMHMADLEAAAELLGLDVEAARQWGRRKG